MVQTARAERGRAGRWADRGPSPAAYLVLLRKESVRDGSYARDMTTDDVKSTYPWEPPFAGGEVEQLLGALDRLRATFRWKADDLDAAGLGTRVGASTLTLGGLLKHLAVTEDYQSTTKLTGEPFGGPWVELGIEPDRDWDFETAGDDSPETLYDVYDSAVVRARARWRAVIDERGLDGEAHVQAPDGEHASVRRLLTDLIEEYGRHTGHADLIREAVDGRVGEDPEAGWRPVSGHYSFG